MDATENTPEYFVIGNADAEGDLVLMVDDDLIADLESIIDPYDDHPVDKRLEVAVALVRAGLQGRIGIERDSGDEPTAGQKQGPA